MWYLSKIPKVAHFYWGNKSLPFSRFFTVASFAALNKDWEIRLHAPEELSDSLNLTWDSHEHRRLPRRKNAPEIKCYWDKVKAIPNVWICEQDLGFLKSASEVHKSDFLRWGLLSKDGGLWSDMDIVYFRPMDDLYLNRKSPEVVTVNGLKHYVDSSKTTEVVSVTGHTNSIGFLIAEQGSNFFRDVAEGCLELVLSNGLELIGKNYQSIGREIIDNMVNEASLNKKVPYYTVKKDCKSGDNEILMMVKVHNDSVHGDFIMKESEGIKNIDMAVVYSHTDPVIHLMIDPSHDYDAFEDEPFAIGTHWYGGHPKMGPYMDMLDERNVYNMQPNPMINIIKRVLDDHRDYLFPA